MAIRSIVSKRTYLAKEAVAGVRQPPNLFLEGLNIRVVPNSTRGEVRPSGSTMRVARPEVMDWSTFSLAAGSYLDYNSLMYPLSGLMGTPTITTPGGGTLSRSSAFQFSSDGLNTRPTFTFAAGYRGDVAEETIRNVFQSFGFGFSRNAAPTITGTGFGRNENFGASLGVNEVNVVTITGGPTGGTFTITVNGQTTSGIAYNATNTTVQTALEALSNVAPGDVAVVGSAGGPYTLTWGGLLANADITITSSGASLTGGSTPAATTTTTQAGGVTTVPVKAIQAPEWDVYCDDTAGGIGTTRIRPYSGQFTFSGLVNPDWVIDSSTTSYDDETLQVPDLSLAIVMRNDTAARALYTSLLAGATKYVRYQATGPIIEGSIHYRFRMDVAVQASENIGQFGDQGGAETMPFPLTIVSDSTFANGGFNAELVNVLTSL